MVAIRLYDIETGHVETLARVASADAAHRWLETFTAGGVGTSDVVYLTEVSASAGVALAGAVAGELLDLAA